MFFHRLSFCPTISDDCHLPAALLFLLSQREQVRASAMISAIPCVATLLELLPEGDGGVAQAAGDGAESSAVQQIKGRVLLQNELSLAYWSKLNTRTETGAWVQ